jgi:hypothetical protein
MPTEKQRKDAKESELLAAKTLYENIRGGESFRDMEQVFVEMKRFFTNKSPAEAQNTFEMLRLLGNASPITVGPKQPYPTKRYPRPDWTIHTATSGPMAGHKVKWTCTWEKMKLRIEHALDVARLVVFNGYIDDELVTSEKHQSRAKSSIEAEATRRAQMRDAGVLAPLPPNRAHGARKGS